jgi:dGTPase
MPKSFSGRDSAALEAAEEALLAPYARRSAAATRRYLVRDRGRSLAYRTAFQRDRDRILHSLAFRRLKHKTQVYVPYEGDHHRTRLTHTLEVAQISRTIARALGLNEDLVEAIALGHDLGQPPFGAAGEETLAALLAGEEPIEGIEPAVLAATGGFRPNYQSLRVADRLEQRYDHPGINLTDPVREGIWKCGVLEAGVEYPDWVAEGLAAGEPALLEGQVVKLSDRLARLTHDLEDGIRAGQVHLHAAERLEIGAAVTHKLGEAYRTGSGRFERQNTLIRGMIHLLVSDAVVHSAANLGAGHDDARVYPDDTVALSPQVATLAAELEAFVETQVYRSFAVSRLDARARTFIRGLFAAYYRDPAQLEDYALLRYRSLTGGTYLRDLPGNRVEAEVATRYHGQPAFLRLIADHIAGMSDSFALKEYERLYLPFPDAEAHRAPR